MFWWLFVRIIGFSGWVVILCLLMAVVTVSSFSQLEIDDAYDREVRAIRQVSIGLDPGRRLPCERRGQVAGKFMGAVIDWFRDSRPRSRVSDGVSDASDVLEVGWWERCKPRLKRLMPLAYIRVETYIVIYLTCVGFYVFSFFLGEYYARLKIRGGVHKRNVLPIWIRRGLWFLRDVSVACTGLVICPPVVYWVIPSVVLSCLVVVLWRANSIQGLAFLTPGKV